MKMVSPNEAKENVVCIDRIFLVKFLIDECEKLGVKFIYNTNILSAVTENGYVSGIKTDKGDFKGDLVIDAAGIDSPVRRSLPEAMGIRKEITSKDYFTAYRAFYEKADDTVYYPPYNTYFFHCNRPGMDWVITDENFIDVLVGSFGELTHNEAMEAVDDFMNDYPVISKKIIRGGQIKKIPLRRTLPLIVHNGYAAVGDSVSMIEPLSGSGITLSMLAGKILADTIHQSKDYSIESLWKYEYKYFKQLEEDRISTDIIKNCLSSFTAEQIDYLFQSKILTEYEIAGGGIPAYTVKDLLCKGANLIKKPNVIPNFIKMFISMARIKSVCKMMPEKYDKNKFASWAKEYENL